MKKIYGKKSTYVEDGMMTTGSGLALLVIDADVVAIENALERNLKQ